MEKATKEKLSRWLFWLNVVAVVACFIVILGYWLFGFSQLSKDLASGLGFFLALSLLGLLRLKQKDFLKKNQETKKYSFSSLIPWYDYDEDSQKYISVIAREEKGKKKKVFDLKGVWYSSAEEAEEIAKLAIATAKKVNNVQKTLNKKFTPEEISSFFKGSN